VACDDDAGLAPEATAGTMIVSLATPNLDDGAIMFTVSGGAIDSPALLDLGHVLYVMEGTNTISAIIAGDIAAGELLEFDVPDVDATYTATITQVADRMNDLRDPLTGYALAVEPEVVE
jgi:hypothetical protein